MTMTRPSRSLVAALALIPGLCLAALPDGSIWLKHARQDLIPYWTQPAAEGDPVGRFPTFRCNDGSAYVAANPCPELSHTPDWIKSELGRNYVRMQSRQVFAYAMAFHLTGDVALLRLAQAGARDIHARALDPSTGSFASWYGENGEPQPAIGERTSQDLSYAGVGLAALYYLTRDPQLLMDLTLLKKHVLGRFRDPATGLVKWTLEGKEGRTELVALLDHLNAYMILVAPALPAGPVKDEWKRDIAALSKTIVDRFYDPASGRFFGTRGNPDSETPRGRHNDFGHSVKAFWMLYLGAQMNGDEKLRTFARDGMRRIVETAYLPATGSWGSRMKPGGEVDAGKEWWIYAELDQALSTLAVEEGDSPERLEHTWQFWLDHMVDKRGGEVWGWVAPDGSAPTGAIKQHQWKNGFHSMEHAVVSYLTAQALNNKPARLYYAVENGMPEFTPSAYTMHGKPRKISTRMEEDVKVVEIEFDLPRSKQVKR
jgi:mannose/cellobiose epimerase-like protein (N-acyl-D-glucosamine 2-epimerase family)